MVDLDFEAMMQDPYPYFAALRGEQRWAWVEPLQMYFVSRYDDVVMVDTDDETFSLQIPNNLMTRTVGTAMARLDGMEHARLRAASGDPLKRRAVHRNWAAVIDGLVEDIVSNLRSLESADLMQDVASPLTGACLREVLGLLDATPADIERWSAAFIAGLINNTDDPAVWATVKVATDEVRESVTSALKRVHDQPDGTVISAMAHASSQAPLSFDEMVSNLELMISGGFNDARDAIATMAWHLMTHPEARDRALSDPVAFERAFSVGTGSGMFNVPFIVKASPTAPGPPDVPVSKISPVVPSSAPVPPVTSNVITTGNGN